MQGQGQRYPPNPAATNAANPPYPPNRPGAYPPIRQPTTSSTSAGMAPPMQQPAQAKYPPSAQPPTNAPLQSPYQRPGAQPPQHPMQPTAGAPSPGMVQQYRPTGPLGGAPVPGMARPGVPAKPVQSASQPLHGQMNSLSLQQQQQYQQQAPPQQNGMSNGHMRPAPRPMPPQPGNLQPPMMNTQSPLQQSQPQQSASRQMYPPQTLQPGFPQPGAQPGGATAAPPPQRPQSFAAQPNAPLRPVNMRPVAPSRPVPPQYPGAQNGGMEGAPPPPGHAPPGPQNMKGQAAQPQQTPQLTTSMVPRPANNACGQPRPYYHRGMASPSGDRTGITIPNSNADYISIDDGCARLRFARLTTNAIASEPNVMTKTGVPFAILMTPFANTVSGEAPVPVVDFSNLQVGGPLRCERCNGYANPGFKFMNGGAEFQCNLCSFVTKTPTEHFSPVSHTGQRMDADSRHELRYGSVEYLVGSPDYCVRPPKPACYMFAIDVSEGAISSGLASSALMSIKSALAAGLLPGSHEGARVAIMTFDRSLHFFDARGAEDGKAVTMQFVPDVMDPFVPLGGEALFLTPAEAVLAIDSAIEIHGLGAEAVNNPERAPVRHVECVLGSALQAVKQAFADCGGKAFVIAGSLPSAGVMKLERRGGGATGGGEERELALLKEANPNFDILGCELAEVQASVDLFLAPSSVYVDASTLSKVPRACGGRMHLFTGFDPIRDGASLHRALCTAAGEARAFEALLRVRASPGLEARGEYIGNFGRPQRGPDLSGPVFDASSTLALELTVTSKLLDDDSDGRQQHYGGAGVASLYDDACVQCAILFTDCAGRRRIRVHTVFAKKTSVLSDVFSHADVDATAAYLAKKAASAVLVSGISFAKAWDAVTEKTSQMFYVYRKHCTQAPVSGQLILPESYKVLPVMMLGLIKSVGLRKFGGSMHAGDAVTVDERAGSLSFVVTGTVSEVAVFCYPRMWDISAVGKEVGVPLPAGSEPPVVENGDGGAGRVEEPICLPNTLPLSAESLSESRILLIENGMQMVVWIGVEANAEMIQSIVANGMGGRVVIRGETANSGAFLKDVNEDGKRIAKVIGRIASERKGLSRPQVVQRSEAGAGGEAKWVLPLLVEDRGGSGGSDSYVEYLRKVHKRVMDKMANDSAQSGLQTWEMLNHGY